MKKISLSLLSALLVLCPFTSVSAFFGGGKSDINQENVCKARSVEEIGRNCKEGDIMVYFPTTWGNEQLPVYITGIVCNINHQVVMNNAGIVCVFTDKRLGKFTD